MIRSGQIFKQATFDMGVIVIASMKKMSGVLLIFAIIICILAAYDSTPGAITSETSTSADYIEVPSTGDYLDEDGSYTSKGDVGLYIHLYGKLPPNFITKKQAQSLGWNGGSLERYAPGKCIGGSYFGNYEGLLPSKDGRTYTECDIDTLGETSRGAKRIVFSNNGLIYYTEDHYESFILLYGDENT